MQWEVGGGRSQLNAYGGSRPRSTWCVTPAVAAGALREFRNVKRRMEVLGIANGITVYDDFAHHPTAIRTTIDGLRRQVGAQRILAVFEPRSNTMKLGTMKAQPWSLEQADLSFCHAGGLGWDPTEALQPMGERRCGARHRGIVATGRLRRGLATMSCA